MQTNLQLNELFAGFRNSQAISALAREIARVGEQLKARGIGEISVMEVCGGHTHAVMKYGINQLVRGVFRFVHGPGCPVCVMPKHRLEHAILLAREPGVMLATLGDMIRVPAISGSLADARAAGASVHFVYSPMDVLALAKAHPERRVVFFAIGFETTTPMTAALIERALREGVRNLFFHINHVLVPPPMRAILQQKAARVEAFIAPSHVSVITGARIYEEFVREFAVPTVVAGFEPTDILEALLMLARQALDGRCELENQYTRSVSYEGNLRAQELIARYFRTRESFAWRGVGEIAHSALKLREEFAAIDAERVWQLPDLPAKEPAGCICARIISGQASPRECPLFGRACRPETAVGSCMVSGEGVCNAYYKYGGGFR